MRYPRGNIESEVKKIESLYPEINYKGLTMRKLKSAFDKIGDYPKPVPKLGRPPFTDHQKKQSSYQRHEKHGQSQLFGFDELYSGKKSVS